MSTTPSGDPPTPAPYPAPLSVRTAAFLVDQAVVTVLVVAPALAVGVPAGDVVAPGRTRTVQYPGRDSPRLRLPLRAGVAGRPVGERLFGPCVVADDGSTPGGASFVRNALGLIDGWATGPSPPFAILARGDGKRLGDALGGTLVVRD